MTFSNYTGAPKPSEFVISVDGGEWYYGRPENRTNPEKRMQITRPLRKEEILSSARMKEINGFFSFIGIWERDTAKRRKRQFFIDRDLLTAK